MAIRLGFGFETAKLFLEHNPALSREDNDEGQVPLHLAMAQHNEAIVDILLEAFPEGVQVIDNAGRTPIALCLQPTGPFLPPSIRPCLWNILADTEYYPSLRAEDSLGILETGKVVLGFEETVNRRGERVVRINGQDCGQGWATINTEKSTTMEVIAYRRLCPIFHSIAYLIS